jgi:hypothetical protein
MEAPIAGDALALVLYIGVSLATFKIDPRIEDKDVKKTEHAIGTKETVA